MFAFIGSLGPTEMIMIALVLVLLFGAKKIPELMRGLGGGIKEFKKASQLEDEDTKRTVPPAAAVPPAQRDSQV